MGKREGKADPHATHEGRASARSPSGRPASRQRPVTMRDCANIALPLLRPAICPAPGMLASVSPTPSSVEFSRRHRRRFLRSSDAARRSTKFTEASEAGAPKRRCIISCEQSSCAWQSTFSQSSSWLQALSSPSPSLLFSPCCPPDRDRWRLLFVPARIAGHRNSITTAQ